MDQYPMLSSVPPTTAQLTLGDVLSLLRRRRWVVGSCCCLCLALAVTYCMFAPRRYESVASIQVQKEDADSLNVESALGSSSETPTDALDYNVTLQTQAKILTSDTLALAVIEKTGLERDDNDFNGKNVWFSLPAWLAPWERVEPDPVGTSLENAPGRRSRALKTFAKRLKVQIEPGTRLIAISFLSPDPGLSADVVNCLIREFTEYNYKTRYAATRQVSEWLGSQLEGLRQRAEEAQAKKVRLQRETGMFGDDERHNIVLTRLDELNSGVTRAEQDRIRAQTLDYIVSREDPDAIGSVGANSSVASGGTSASLALLQSLRERQAELGAQIGRDRLAKGSKYPKSAGQKAELQSIDRSIEQEIQRIKAVAHREYLVAEAVERESRERLNEQRALIAGLGAPTLAYTMAKQEADSSRDLYEGLSKRLTAASVLSGLRSSNVTIVDPARAAPRNHPKQPNIPFSLVAGCFCALLLGGVCAYAFDASDPRVYARAQIEQTLGAPPLVVLPVYDEAATGIPPHVLGAGSESAYAEALRSLRTSLTHARGQEQPRVILVTSALASEGKTMTALNLATVLGQQGGRVLLVDGDLRRPELHHRLSMQNEDGLSSLLAEAGRDARPLIRKTGGNGDLWFLAGGPRPVNPAELLGRSRMDELIETWRADFDHIVIDAAPVLSVTDAVLLATRVDAVLMLVRYRVSTRESMLEAHTLIRRYVGKRKVGVILNGADRSSEATYYRYRPMHASSLR